MQSIWDLLPASLWPTQPFIPPDQQARIMQKFWAQQSSASSFSPAPGSAANLVGAPAWQAPNPMSLVRGGDDMNTAGGILSPIFGSSIGAPPAASLSNLPPPQTTPSVPVASMTDQLDPSSPPAAVPAAPQANTASNATLPIGAPAKQSGGALGAGASGLTPAEQEAASARSMLPRLPSPEDPYGRAPPEGWFMRQLDQFDPPLAASIRNGSAWEPITAPAQSIGPNIRQAAKNSAQLFRDGAHEAIHGNTLTGPARMTLGTLGFLYSPLTGLGQTLGQEATKWTGNPDFGRKIELLAPFVIPAGAGALARSVGSRASTGAEMARPLDLDRARTAPDSLSESQGLALGRDEIDYFRIAHGVPTQNTIAVARTNVPGLERELFTGASPLVREEARMPPAMKGRVESPVDNPQYQNHAEEDVINRFLEKVDELKLQPSDLDGYKLAIHVSNPKGVCPVCRWGLDSDRPAGVLKQLSHLYPGLEIRVSVETEPGIIPRGPTRFVIKNEEYIRRSDQQ